MLRHVDLHRDLRYIPAMHPIIFTFPDWLPLLGGAHIYSYGLMLGIAFLTGWYLGMHLSLKEGLRYKFVNNAYFVAIICSLIGARIAYLISNPSSWRFSTGFVGALFSSRCEGLVAYGGYIGGVLGAAVYARMKRADLWGLFDSTAPSLVLGLGFTRIGCFLAGCCHGKPTDLPWAIVFPPGSQGARNFPGIDGYSQALHPTQLYESLLGFALVPLALWLHRRRKFTGQTFLVMVMCYAVGRFLLELLRGDDDRGGIGQHAAPLISTSQLIGLMLLPVALGLYFYRMKVGQPPPQPRSREEIEKQLLEEGVKKSRKKK